MKKNILVMTICIAAIALNACGGNDADYTTRKSSKTKTTTSTVSADGFKEYLKENDPSSYESYKKLEKNWNSGNWDSENGFFGK